VTDDKNVYFIRPVGQRGPIKIGCSVRPATRLRDIEIWSPVLLEIIATAPGGHPHELALHDKFAADHLHGEWFAASTDLERVIDYVKRTGALPPLSIARGGDAERKRVDGGVRKPRRGNATQEKIRLTKMVQEAEKHAYGYGWHDAPRPPEITKIIVSYQGWATPAPSEAEQARLTKYADKLHSLPRQSLCWNAFLEYVEKRNRQHRAA
jgi:hypothetical protein